MRSRMLKLRVLNRIVESGLVAVIRAERSDQASRIGDACAEGGVRRAAKTGDFQSIAALARRFIEEIRRARA